MSTRSTSKWRCTICDYEVVGEKPPSDCPVCGASSDKFEPVDSRQDSTPIRDVAGNAISVEGEASMPPLSEYLAEWKRSDYEMEEN